MQPTQWATEIAVLQLHQQYILGLLILCLVALAVTWAGYRFCFEDVLDNAFTAIITIFGSFSALVLMIVLIGMQMSIIEYRIREKAQTVPNSGVLFHKEIK